MRIFNMKNAEVKSHNLKKGRLKEDRVFIKHHDAVEAVAEEGHWETIAVYPETGGKDVKWVVDVPGVAAKEAYDEYEDVLRYVEYSKEELDAMLKAPLTLNEKLTLFAESIKEEPYPNTSPKAGYMYRRVYSTASGTIVWTLVPDQDNPIKFTKGMSVIEGLYYTDESDVHQCIQNGDPKSLRDTKYFKKVREEG